MTFGQHLEELRRALFRALFGLVIGVVVGLFFGRDLVHIINRPLEQALTGYYQKESWGRADALVRADAENHPEAFPDQDAIDAKTKQYYDLIYDKQLLCQEYFINSGDALMQLPGQDKGKTAQASPETSISLTPVLLWHRVADDARIQSKSLSPHEGFMIYLKGSLLIGAILASPWVFYQIWSFVAAGLYPHEKRYVNVYLPFSVFLFLSGVAVAYFFVFGPVLGFLFQFNRLLGITPDLRISEWLGFVLMLPLGFGIAFQLPLVMLFLERIGVFTVKHYMSYWRVAILVIFVVAAIFTPPDPWSMSLLAVPLTFLYFGGILLCKFMPKGKSLFPTEADG